MIPSRILRRVAAAAALAVLLAACGGTVATVNGEPIARDDVLGIRTAYDGAARVSGETFRSDLTTLIVTEALLQAAADQFGLTDLDSDQAVEAFLADPGPDADLLASLAGDLRFTEDALRLQAKLLNLRRQVIAALLQEDPAFLEQLFVERPETLTQVCVRHILVATEAEADAAARRIADGEDFSAVADDVSLDILAPGGQLPCPSLAADYATEFAKAATVAPVGEVFGPVATQFGWHLLLVDERFGPESLEELRANPGDFVSPQLASELFGTWLNEVLDEADIDVDSAVGSWFPEADAITPPPS